MYHIYIVKLIRVSAMSLTLEEFPRITFPFVRRDIVRKAKIWQHKKLAFDTNR